MRWKTLVTLAALLCVPAAARADDEADARGSQDHPLVTRFPGFRISHFEVKDFAELELPLPSGTRTVAGKHTHLEYTRKAATKEISEVQLMRNYEAAIKKAGGTVLDARTYDGRLVGQVRAGRASVWVLLQPDSGAGYYQLDLVEEKGMEQEVEADARALADSIGTTGKVAVYGIHFDTGKAVVKPESEPVLQQIAKMLEADPSLKLHVVGHTDNQGSVESNVKLSRERADAVIKALAARHGIAAARLLPAGVGPWCPVAPNAAEAGRARNRRVELVKQ